ncbi:hypothetical protein AcW1_008745 [Taiwanofungus camphoratus]|nr:hypothetical protein AcW1_008745 [Antrodia cinnamomea]
MAGTVFPITIDDTSPTVSYAPFADTFGVPDLLAGWNPYYTYSGFAADPYSSASGSSVSNVGNGTSLHLTACDSAAFAIRWNGTAVTIYGTLTSGASATSSLSYSVSLDGDPTTDYVSSLSSPASVESASGDVLAAFSNLTDTAHEIVLTAHNSGMSKNGNSSGTDSVLAFDRAVVWLNGGAEPSPTVAIPTPTSPMPSVTETLTSSTVPDNLIAYRGQWSYALDLLPSLPSAAFHTSTNVGDSAHVMFNGTAVTIAGLTAPSSGNYNITLDDSAPEPFSARASFTSTSPTLLFFAAGLDPNVTHTLEIVNAGSDGSAGAGMLLVVLVGGVNVTTEESVDVATPVGATSSSSIPRGTIAAIAIGVSLAFIALLALIIFIICWRRRLAHKKRSMMVNPRFSQCHINWRGFCSPGTEKVDFAGQTEPEKVQELEHESVHGIHEENVLDISGENVGDDDAHGDNYNEKKPRGGTMDNRRSRRRHAAQNSDGSFSIELPDLSPISQGYFASTSFPSQSVPSRWPSSPLTPSPVSPVSPRTSRPRGPREMHGRESSQGILLSHIITPSFEIEAEENSAPLRVGFARQQGRPERRAERHLSAGALSLPQSLRQALGRSGEAGRADDVVETEVRLSRPSTLRSFLDLSSSASASTSYSGSRARSIRQSLSNSRSNSKSTRSSTRSRQNTGSERSIHNPPERRMSLGLSVTIGGGPTASRPSLTPDISLQPVSLVPPVTLPSSASDPGLLSSGALPSPTDSIPLTVSDIHFRHSAHSSSSHMSESRRTSAARMSGSHRPPHPPLPGAGSSSAPPSPTAPIHAREGSQVVRPYIVQKLMGISSVGSGPSTPFVSPTTSIGPRTDPPDPGSGASASASPSAGQSSTVFGFGLGRR